MVAIAIIIVIITETQYDSCKIIINRETNQKENRKIEKIQLKNQY